MSDFHSPEVPPEVSVPSPEDLARMFAVSGFGGDPPSRPGRSARAKLLGAILIAGIGIGASVLSCVGQSFSLRQARALEGIEQQLTRIQSCRDGRAAPLSASDPDVPSLRVTGERP
jgi:hypothetical protein